MKTYSVYYYKDKPYRVLHLSSIKLDDKWIPCVVYACMYSNPDGVIWVRTKKEFEELFKVKALEETRKLPLDEIQSLCLKAKSIKHYRLGQAFYNVLSTYHPDIAEGITNTKYDPFNLKDQESLQVVLDFLTKPKDEI